MNLPIVLSPAADRDIEAAAEWYEREARSGRRFVARVQEALDRIGHRPDAPALVYKNVRRAPVLKFPYHLDFRVLTDRVEVLAVVHGRRDPSVWQSRA